MKTSCQLWLIVIHSVSEWVSEWVRTQVGQNSWTCDDPKFQWSPKTIPHQKNRSGPHLYIVVVVVVAHIPRAERETDSVELIGKMFWKYSITAFQHFILRCSKISLLSRYHWKRERMRELLKEAQRQTDRVRTGFLYR
jgi:hypothetical protein